MESDNKLKKGKKFIIITRHGERIDRSYDSAKQKLNSDDPELSEEGRLQAKKIGIKVKELFNKAYPELKIFENKNNFQIVSSPFSRCLETSELILEEIYPSEDKDLKDYIKLDNQIAEVMHKRLFKKESSTFLSIYNYKKQDKKRNLLSAYNSKFTNFTNHEEITSLTKNLPKLYETDKDVIIRMKEVYSKYKLLFENNPSLSIVWIISHASPVSCFLNMFTTKPMHWLNVDFCDSFIFESKNGTEDFKFSASINL